uniref:WAP domain-containing protein n=1 Tax=Terrapene triunguis TaxID=2587831 RepID=A0A674K6W7_9SAUR
SENCTLSCCLALQGGVYTVHVFLAEKSGTCPVVPFRCKMRNPPNHCQSDSQCVGEEKCCETGCGLNCVLTQKGTCLIVYSLWVLVPQGALTLSLLSQGQYFSL